MSAFNTELWIYGPDDNKAAEEPVAAAYNEGRVTLTITLPAMFLTFLQRGDDEVCIAPYEDCLPTFSFSADSEFGRDLIKRGVVYICVETDLEVDLPEDQGIERFDPGTIDERWKEVGPEGLPDSFYLEDGLGTAWFRKASLTDLDTLLEEAAAAKREAFDVEIGHESDVEVSPKSDTTVH